MPKIDKLTNQQQLDLKTGQAIQGAAGDLPETWEVTICIAAGSADVALTDPEGDNVEFNSNREFLNETINDAVDHARAMEKLKSIDRSEPEPTKPAFKRKVGH